MAETKAIAEIGCIFLAGINFWQFATADPNPPSNPHTPSPRGLRHYRWLRYSFLIEMAFNAFCGLYLRLM